MKCSSCHNEANAIVKAYLRDISTRRIKGRRTEHLCFECMESFGIPYVNEWEIAKVIPLEESLDISIDKD